jgi:hypothetical protein
MHWDEELERLALHKTALQRRIARQRMQCAIAASRMARPVELLDRIVAVWRGLPPMVKFGAMPLGVLATRLALPRRGILRSLVRWGPLVFSVVSALGTGANGGAAQRAHGRETWRARQRST